MPTILLSMSQLRLLDSLLDDHQADGTYWGKKKDHENLVQATRDAVQRALEGK